MSISEFEFDDINEDKIRTHGLTPAQVQQILEYPYVSVPNRKGRAALRLLLGRTRGGQIIAVPAEPTAAEGRWRPITAWPAKPGEVTEYRKRVKS